MYIYISGPPEFCDSVITEKIADFSVFCGFTIFREFLNYHGITAEFVKISRIFAINL